jgi:enediyne biosynthesis protein E4
MRNRFHQCLQLWAWRTLPAFVSRRSTGVAAALLLPALLAAGAQPGLVGGPLPARAPRPAGAPLFAELPPERTGVDFGMRLPDLADNVQRLLHLSVLGGICAGDYDGDGLPDFFVTSPVGGGRLFRNRGGFRFEDVTEKAGLRDTNFWGTGAVMVDVNGDCRLDLYVCAYRSPNRLFINQGPAADGITHFTEEAARYGLDFNGASMSAAFADYDGDGRLDCFLATTAVPPPPNLRFRVVFEGDQPVIPDELKDYWALIYLPGERAHQTEAAQRNRLFRNTGDRFVEVTDTAGITGHHFTLAAVWWDVNGDGWPDLYVANDYYGPDQLWLNQHDGTFKDVNGDTVPYTPWSSMGVDFGDLTNDGRLDFIATDMLGTTHYRRNVMLGEVARIGWFLEFAEPRQYSRNTVFLNTGTSRMLEAGQQTGLAATGWTWAPRAEDFDEDGRVDVVFTTGMLRDVQHADLANYADKVIGGGTRPWAEFWAGQQPLREPNRAFRNLGDLRFEDVGERWGLNRLGVSFGLATADFDGDGDLDLVVSNADGPVTIYENRSSENHRLRVRLEGRDGNRFGIGATVRLKAGGLEQTRYLATTRGWLGGSAPELHFGLGTNSQVDSLVVEWPGSRRQEFGLLPANQLVVVRAPETPLPATAPARAANQPDTMFQESPLLGDLTDVLTSFDDYLQQPLLPYRLSQTRFCMAWADVNGDGRPDLFLGGGVGESGRLFLQTAPGRFEPVNVPAFQEAALHADTAAEFFDANGDGKLDLFVVSGGVEAPAGHATLYQSRLYLNDGRGGFELAPENALPIVTTAGSCLAVGDVNGDGQPDVFIGGGPVPGQYPRAGSSRLWLNRGGAFVEASPPELARAGLVTAAVFGDVNGDGRPDLSLATEWGPVRLFLNRDGRLVETTTESGLAGRTGWWRSLALADVEGDGDLDLIAGNLGLNTKYQPSPAQPALLFYGPFGGGGSNLIIEAYHERDQLYPQRGFDELFRQQLALRDRFLNFHEFSSTNLSGVFPPGTLQSALRLEANTAESGVWLNDGRGRFTFQPLPPVAQLAPINDLAVLGFDGDGHLELVAAQNDFTPDKLTGRFNGGLSLLLRGDGRGGFAVVTPMESGIVIPWEARRVRAVDVDGDGRRDLVVGVPGAGLRTLLRTPP